MRAALEGLAGISRIEVDLGRDAFSICYEANELSVDRIQRAISELGYKPRLATTEGAVGPMHPQPFADPPESVAGALAKARESNRLVLVDFYAEWCAPCKALEADVLRHPEVQKALEGFVLIKVDTDEFHAAGKHFQVVAIPTLLALDGAGREIHRWVGMVEARELARRLMDLSQAATGYH